MQMRDAELIATVRKIAALQTKARRLRRQLKRVSTDLRHERRMLRGLRQAINNPPDVVPSRLIAGVGGFERLHSKTEADK